MSLKYNLPLCVYFPLLYVTVSERTGCSVSSRTYKACFLQLSISCLDLPGLEHSRLFSCVDCMLLNITTRSCCSFCLCESRMCGLSLPFFNRRKSVKSSIKLEQHSRKPLLVLKDSVFLDCCALHSLTMRTHNTEVTLRFKPPENYTISYLNVNCS